MHNAVTKKVRLPSNSRPGSATDRVERIVLFQRGILRDRTAVNARLARALAHRRRRPGGSWRGSERNSQRCGSSGDPFRVEGGEILEAKPAALFGARMHRPRPEAGPATSISLSGRLSALGLQPSVLQGDTGFAADLDRRPNASTGQRVATRGGGGAEGRPAQLREGSCQTRRR